MHPLTHLFASLIGFLITALGIYMFVVLVTVILHMLVQFNIINTQQPFVRKLYEILQRITEPALRPLRQRLPAIGGIDWSPIALYLILILIQTLLDSLRYSIVYYDITPPVAG